MAKQRVLEMVLEGGESQKLLFLSNLVQEVNKGRTISEVLNIIYWQLRDFIPYNRIGVAILNEGREKVTLIACRSDGKVTLPIGFSGDVKGSSLEPLIGKEETRIINDLEEYLHNKPSSESTKLIIKEGMRSSLTLPLIAGGKPVGVMFFSSRKANSYNKDHEEFLKLIVGHISYVLERVHILDELKETKDYLEGILRNSADAIIIVNNENLFISWNEGATRMFGYKEKELLGKHIDIILPPEERTNKEAEQIQKRIEKDGYIKDYECVRITKDGRRILVNLTSTILKDARGKVIGRSSIVRDVTHIRHLQEENLRSQSLAVIGELAASVAHEIKNPLAGISGAMQVIKDNFPSSDPRSGIINEVLMQVHRLDATVKDLLIFSKPYKPECTTFNFLNLVREVCALLKREKVSQKVNFHMNGKASLPVYADEKLVELVLINILKNAVEAMKECIGTIHIDGEPKEDGVYITIKDTGCGVSPEQQQKLFKPFFSTKARGTGLGLAISKKIMDAHNGYIEFASRPKQGTTVTLYFPRVR
ncbi:MEKHLA domain-containing protein [Candidatus Peregrinibacteria bacterium]|nr:MEKHLA domain-containing protein [Candidatus Peregrinibacteria bacterium]